MDTLASPFVFRRRATLDRLLLDAGLEIGAGGEAVVYEVPGDRALVAKVYHEPTIERARKLTLMLANPPRMPAETAIAWPADLLLGAHGFAGFVMPYAAGPRLFEFYNPVTRRATAPAFHFGLLHRAGRNLAAAFDALHAAGYVVGDVNESNILVHPRSAAVTLVDADSFQVRDAEAGTTFRSRVGKAEFTPPELQGVSFTDVDRSPAHDRFGLAVLLFLLLMEGTHPFAVRMRPGADALPVEDRIRRGLFPHASEDDEVHPPRLSPRFAALHPGLRALFVRAFVAGHADPAARPSPAEWSDALAAAEAALAECTANGLHRYDSNQTDCPWCERAAALGGRDPFPAGAAHAPVLVRQRPRRARVQAPFAPDPLDPTQAAMAFGVHPPFPAMGFQPATMPPPAPPVVPNGPPLPAVFGASGIAHPLVIAMTAIAVWIVAHGTLSVIGLIVAAVSVFQLFRMHWENVRASTVALGVCAALFAGSMVALAGLPADSYGDDSYESDPITYDQPSTTPSPDAVPPAPAEPTGDTDPPKGGSMLDVMLADLYSTPLSRGARDPGPTPDAGHSDGTVYDARTVDRFPALENAEEAANALAWSYASMEPPPPQAEESAILWLHVGPDGRVTGAGRQLIRSTSREAGSAAMAAIPYLVYRPAMKNGAPVDVWITQRMVFVP